VGNGHVIDPDGEARRALHEAVARHGPQALSNAVIMDGICRARLAGLPGEAALIASAARTDVPALLRDLIPELGNYGAIQSAASTLAGAHGLELAGCVWVVREFARALGLIAGGRPGTATGSGGPAGSGGGPGSGAGGTAAEAGSAAPGGPRAPRGPGVPGGVPGGAGATPPGRRPSGSRLLSRNTVGVAAAVAVVAAYLGVAAVAHLSPFPAERGTTASSPSASQPASANPSPSQSPDPSPTSDYKILLSKIPGTVQGQGSCRAAGTSLGAAAVSECARLRGLGAGTIYYYLFSGHPALHDGFGSFLQAEKFKAESQCTNSSNRFVDFITQCESGFTNATPDISGDVAEYANAANEPIIVSTDDQQLVMAIMVGTNGGDLLSYWKQMQWVAS